MVFSEGQLHSRLLDIKTSRDSILSFVFLLLYFSKIFHKAESPAVRSHGNCHARIRFNLRTMSIQHWHHNSRSFVLHYSLVSSFLLHQTIVQLCCIWSLNAKWFLPFLKEGLENKQVIIVTGLLLREINQITDCFVWDGSSLFLILF